MCWMAGRLGENAAREAVAVTAQHECDSGGHSWGYAALVDGELVFDHGVGTIPHSVSVPDSTAAIAHTRYATQGEITIENAHPFPVYESSIAADDPDSKPVAALCHNGTWYGAPKTDRCDSYYIARVLEKYLGGGLSMEKAVQYTGNHVGETFLVLDHSGNLYTHAGRFTITADLDAPRVQSSGFDPLPEGVYTLPADEARTQPTTQATLSDGGDRAE